MELARIDRELAAATGALSFASPVTHVYNPLVYAWEPHHAYLEKYGQGRKEVLILGMNPGPFGMGQTGVPFGDVSMVREWLGIEAPVRAPEVEHPRRPVRGFDCRRSEVSGTRLWSWARDRFDKPEKFFDRFFVVNYCPLLFLEESGRNRTPDKLPRAEREPLLEMCDEALRSTVQLLEPKRILGVGTFARKCAKRVFAGELPIDAILHPSPASPKANRGWAEEVDRQLAARGIRL